MDFLINNIFSNAIYKKRYDNVKSKRLLYLFLGLSYMEIFSFIYFSIYLIMSGKFTIYVVLIYICVFSIYQLIQMFVYNKILSFLNKTKG